MALPIRRGNGDRADRASRADRPETAPSGPFGELGRLTSPLDSWDRLPDLLRGFTPLADVEETSEAYLVEIELPGVKREDIDIEIGGQHLSVRGDRKERERVGILRRRERTVGHFTYEVTLPSGVDEDAVEAHLTEGVLQVRLPKPERDRPRRIEIH